KGQYSPTSHVGTRTKATPYGSIDRPFNPISVALGAGATFVARTIDSDQKHMASVLEAAAKHRGSAFIEIFQDCVIFNGGAFDEVADKKVRKEKTFNLSPGDPMIYGAESEKGIKIDGFNVAACDASEASVWNASTVSTAPGVLMAEIERDPAGLPTPVGIFRSVEAPVFEVMMHEQMKEVTASKGPGSAKDLVYSGDIWEVE
ncbi:MAG: 2-oxoglutarate ferredoxin oxidoreductase subunit beta, partial [Planctomycetota bacterium]